jgi:CheY-like chemotaxis protein
MALILVVEDIDQFRTVICGSLEMGGHEVLSSGSAKEALQLCQGKTFDLVLTDLMMPSVDGIELIRALRTFRRELPILVISGAPEEMLNMAITLGANAILRKPFDLDGLLDAIDKLLNPKNASREERLSNHRGDRM